MGPPSSTTRRAFLCLGGSALLAGCTGLSRDGSSEGTDQPTTTPPPSLDRDRIQQAATRQVPETRAAIPVTITDDYLSRSQGRARTLLDKFEAKVGNVESNDRQTSMREVANTAEKNLEKSRTATTEFNALVAARSARTSAMEVLWWARAALDEDDLNDALDARGPVRERLREFRGRNWYIGPDLDTTLVTAEHVEDWAGASHEALSEAESLDASTRVYRVGRTAERIEAARAFLDDASHLATQLRDSEDVTDYETPLMDVMDSFSGSLSKTVNDVDQKYNAQPEEMFDHEITNASAELVSRAYSGMAYHANWMQSHKEEDAIASVLHRVMRVRRDKRVFDAVRSEVEENGDAYPRLESAERVDDAKQSVIAAFEDARSANAHPSITATFLFTLAIEVSNADHRMETVLDGDYTPDEVYDAAIELWAVPVFAKKRLTEQPAAIESTLDEIEN